MFNSVFGLPLHILVVHAVVVLGPISGFCAIAYAARPAWRWTLKWPTMILALIAGVSSFVASQSGEALEHRLRDLGIDGQQMELVHQHAEAGDLAGAVGGLFMVLTLVLTFWPLSANRNYGVPPHVADPVPSGWWRSPVAQAVSVAVMVLMAVVFIAAVTVAGHFGAVATWDGIY
ncbi:MAG: DUF2231 domain-containing protein [Nostocoides sp.]